MAKSNRVEIIGFECANETGRIVKRTKHTPPAAGYHLVQFDCDGGKLWVHESRLKVASQA